jgi:hypothetical protein
VDAKFLPVAVGLPAGYLSVQPFGLGKGVSHLFYLIQLIVICTYYNVT